MNIMNYQLNVYDTNGMGVTRMGVTRPVIQIDAYFKSSMKLIVCDAKN